MVTMERPTTRICSWDSEPNPRYNFHTTGNVEEIVPGVVKPLIADYLRRMDAAGVRELHQRVGVEDLVHAFDPPVANFLAVFGGRMALNLGWANALISTWQTTDEGSGLMDQFITTSEADIRSGGAADRERAKEVHRRVHSSFWPQCAAAIDRNNERVAAAGRKLSETDITTLSPAALWHRVESLITLQGHMYANHIGVSGAAGEYASLTARMLLEELGDSFEDTMVAGLTTGLGEIESARPGFELWKLGRFVAAKPTLLQGFRTLDAAALVEALTRPADNDWHTFARAFTGFLATYGFRGQQEADISVESWAENPAFVLSVIRTNAEAPPSRDPALFSGAARDARRQLEERLAASVSRSRRREFLRTAGLAQHYARNRERTKACWVRSMRLGRPLLLQLAHRAVLAGSVAQPDDVFFLTLAEVEAFATSSGHDWRPAVAARKAEAAAMSELALPALFEAPPVMEPAAAQTTWNDLAGLGVSGGNASGPARIVRSAAAAIEAGLRPGEVLVAPFTDAAWTPLFVTAAAVVVETGGLLSHAAIVAREFGIPAVVSVKGATSIIRDGQMVSVDGRTGAVTVA